MRIYVFDTGLRDRTGHHSHFAMHVPQSLAPYDVDLRYFAHVDSPEEYDSIKVVPHFRHYHYRQYMPGAYRPAPGAGYDRLYEEIMSFAREFAADIAALGEGAPGNDDFVYLHTAGLREALGLSQWMKESGRKPRVAMLFHNAFPWDRDSIDLGEGTVGGLLYRITGRAIKAAVDSKRCLIGATNKGLADLIARPLGMRVGVFPAPIWYGNAPGVTSGAAEVSADRPIISLLGHTRPDKGFEQIPNIIRRIHELTPEATVICHLNKSVRQMPLDFTIYEKLEQEGLVQLVKGFLPDEELNALIRRSSFLLMPYNRASYRTTLSGVFALATAMGRPSIVPTDTWMANQISMDRAAGVTFADDMPDTIAEAVAQGVRDRAALIRRAEALAPGWCRERSGEALVTKLMEWAGVKRKD